MISRVLVLALVVVLAGCEKKADPATASAAAAALTDTVQPALATLHRTNWGEAPKGYRACAGGPEPTIVLDALFLFELSDTGEPGVPGPQPLFRTPDTRNLQQVLLDRSLGRSPKWTASAAASVNTFATSQRIAITVQDVYEAPRAQSETSFLTGLALGRIYVVDRATGEIACQTAYFARSSEKVSSMKGQTLEQKALESDFTEQHELAVKGALGRLFKAERGTLEKLALGVLQLAKPGGETARQLLDAPDLADRVAALGDEPAAAPEKPKVPELPKEKGPLDGLDGILNGKTVYLQPDGGYADTPPPPPAPAAKKKKK